MKDMSRTYALASPSRRSKRLLENGYYRVQTDDPNFLDLPASDEDDSASVDSDVSKLSLTDDQRNINYKESPPGAVFNSRKRQFSHSPVRRLSSSMMNMSARKVRQNVSFSENQLHTIFSRKNITSSNSYSEEHLKDVAAETASDRALLKNNEVEQHYVAKAHSVSGPSLSKSHKSFQQQKSKFLQQIEEAGDGDGGFKVPSAMDVSSLHKPYKKLQNQSADYLSSDEDFFDKENIDAEHPVVVETTVVKWYMFLCYLVHVIKSYVVGLVWYTGKLFYQGVTNVLVLDVKILSTKVKVGGSINQKYFKKAAIFLLACIFIALLFFGLPLLLARKVEFVTQNVTPTSGRLKTVTVESEQNVDTYYRSIKELKEYIQAVENKFTVSHSSIVDTVNQLLQLNGKKDDKEHSRNQKELLSGLEMMIRKSIEEEGLKVSDKFENKFEYIQMELSRLRANHSLSLLQLREMKGKFENSHKSSELNLLQLNSLEKQMVQVENRVVQLTQDYNTFKSSANRLWGNVTYLRQISNEQFITNFQVLLEESTGIQADQKSDNLRHTYLARIFVMWLDQKGFAQKEALERMKSEIVSNSTRMEDFFKDALENSINDLKMTYFNSVHKTTVNVAQHHTSTEITENLIKLWIKEALDLYSADRVGEADFALETAGGSILNTRCSETFHHKTALVSILGIPIYYNINTPRSLIQPGVMPGECWAYQGDKGFVVISLATTVRPTAFTLDHIPKTLSPNNNISSAPKDFSVLGLNDSTDVEGILLGSFSYDKDGDAMQRFAVRSKAPEIEEGFRYIELRVTSNWGNPQFTCIYRFRVHGHGL